MIDNTGIFPLQLCQLRCSCKRYARPRDVRSLLGARYLAATCCSSGKPRNMVYFKYGTTAQESLLGLLRKVL